MGRHYFQTGVMDMNWKSFFIGLSSGLAGGLAAYYFLTNEERQASSPEKILEQVKHLFKEQGPISGSWIHMKAEPYEKDQLKYMVYKGGISKKNADSSEQYEFIADSTTGTLLSITKL